MERQREVEGEILTPESPEQSYEVCVVIIFVFKIEESEAQSCELICPWLYS